MSNPDTSQLKSAWACPSVGFTALTIVHSACDKVGSSTPPSKSKCKNKVILYPADILFVVKPKKLNLITLLTNSNLFICLKNRVKPNIFLANLYSPFIIFILVVMYFPNNISKFNSLIQIILCSNINDTPFDTPENLHLILIWSWAVDIGIVHTDSVPRGNVIGIRNLISRLISSVIFPIISKVPSDSANEVSIKSIISIFGTFTLFTSKE